MLESISFDDRLRKLAQTNRDAARFGTKEQLIASEHALVEAINGNFNIWNADLTGIYLADITYPFSIHLTNGNLSGACLSNQNIKGSWFINCHFDGASLDGMQARDCSFDDCKFGMAIMDRNDFDWTFFHACDMTRISFYSYPSVRQAILDLSLVSPGFLAYLESLEGDDRPASLPIIKSR